MRLLAGTAVLLCGAVCLASVARGADQYVLSPRCEPIPLPEQPGPARCVMKPDKREVKKTVYEVKYVPYCLAKAYCGTCRDCEKPCPKCEKCVRWKKVVVKRDIVVDELCCYKCAAEDCCPKKATTDEDGVPPSPKPAAKTDKDAGKATVPPAPPAMK